MRPLGVNHDSTASRRPSSASWPGGRLLGQGLGSDCIFCVGDKVANDPVWKTTLKMGKPANVKLVIKDMEHAIEAINSGVTDKYKMIICVASIAEAKQLVDGCPQITSINLGNTKSKDEQRPDARKISRQIFVTAAEEEDIRELVGRGVEVEIRALADDPKVDALSALWWEPRAARTAPPCSWAYRINALPVTPIYRSPGVHAR